MWRLFSTTWEDGIITEGLEAGIPALIPRGGKETRCCVKTLIHQPFPISSELGPCFYGVTSQRLPVSSARMINIFFFFF